MIHGDPARTVRPKHNSLAQVYRVGLEGGVVLVLSLCIASRAKTPPQYQIPPLRGKLNITPPVLPNRVGTGLGKVPLVLMVGFGYDPGYSIVKLRPAGLHPQAVLYQPFRRDQLLDVIETPLVGQDS